MKLSLVPDSLSHLSFDALLKFRKIGEGILADQFWPIAKALKEDGYDSVISYEKRVPSGRRQVRGRLPRCNRLPQDDLWGATRFAARESRFSHWLAATP